jgi:hypothetical protein
VAQCQALKLNGRQFVLDDWIWQLTHLTTVMPWPDGPPGQGGRGTGAVGGGGEEVRYSLYSTVASATAVCQTAPLAVSDSTDSPNLKSPCPSDRDSDLSHSHSYNSAHSVHGSDGLQVFHRGTVRTDENGPDGPGCPWHSAAGSLPHCRGADLAGLQLPTVLSAG